MKRATCGAVLLRLLLGVAAAMAATGAGWVNPSAGLSPDRRGTAASGSSAAAPLPPPDWPATVPDTAGPPLVVSAWTLGGNAAPAAASDEPVAAPAGRPFYLRLTLEGNAAAVKRMREEGGLPILVHWSPEAAAAGQPAPAPSLTTRLTIGSGSVASALAGEVEHKGRFTWHTWTQKNTLSPGEWSVSLTYPDGQPLLCGAARQPCRFPFRIG